MLNSDSRRAAFFDVDGTLISIKSLVSFIQYLDKSFQKPIKLSSMPVFIGHLHEKLRSNAVRLELNRQYFALYKNLSQTAISEVARNWFADEEGKDGFYIEESIRELKRLKAEGYAIVLVTGSFLPLLETLSQRLQVDDILCTTPECIGGTYTGELIGNPCIGINKRRRVLQYAIAKNIDLANSWAFGDDDSDQPMLDTVGHGVRIASFAH